MTLGLFGAANPVASNIHLVYRMPDDRVRLEAEAEPRATYSAVRDATISISTFAPIGSAATAIVERAGWGSLT